MVGFLNVAQRRGAFNFRESGKIGECITRFIRQQVPTQPTPEQIAAAAEAHKAAAAEAAAAEAAPAEAEVAEN